MRASPRLCSGLGRCSFSRIYFKEMFCKMCNKAIIEGRTFCNKSCSTRFRNLSLDKHPVKKICEWCNKEFEVRYFLRDKAKFCSRSCRLSYQRRNNKIFPCSYCGNPVVVDWKRRNTKRFFCSADCYYKAIAGKSEVTCSGCGKAFTAFKSRQGYYSKLFCSKNCYSKHGNLSTPGYIHNEKYEKIRQRLSKYAQYLHWKIKVLERDDYKCTQCKSDKKLRVHHILKLYLIVYKYNPSLSLDKLKPILESKEFNDISNGKTLCNSCHLKEHQNSPLIK